MQLAIEPPNPLIDMIDFNIATRLTIGASLADIAVGDFDGDGQLDVVVSNTERNNVSILLGDGEGGLTSSTSLLMGSVPYGVTVGDFDGDGNLDIGTANTGANSVGIRFGSGTGSFGSLRTIDLGTAPFAITLANVNRDNRPDIITANRSADGLPLSTASLVLSRRASDFAAPTTLTTELAPADVVVGDFDGNQQPDIAIANAGSNSVSVILNAEDSEAFPIGTAPLAVTTGDFNGDGHTDLATANPNDNSASVLLGDGQGQFTDSGTFSVGQYPSAIVSGDFDGDGQVDLALANYVSDTVSILLGDGSGGFADAQTVELFSGAYSMASGDFNGDGRLDLVVASFASGVVSVLLNQPNSGSSGTSSPLGNIVLAAPVINALLETQRSIDADLQTGELVINAAQPITRNVAGFTDVFGTQLSDRIVGSGADNLILGGDGKDTITGLGGNDNLDGGAGNDTLRGGNGIDTLAGDAGNDRLIGNGGSDILTGGFGKDVLTTGGGRDRIVFDIGEAFKRSIGRDRITDFRRRQDTIVLDQTTFTEIGDKVKFAVVRNVNQAKRSKADITYLRSKGQLFYNANGNKGGFGKGGLFAIIDNPKSSNGRLKASNFEIQE